MAGKPAHILAGLAIVGILLLVFIAARRTSSAPVSVPVSTFAVIPPPATYYLRGDGQWATTAMTGGSAIAPGTAGFVPPPSTGDHVNFLRGDGQWTLQPLPPLMGAASTTTAGTPGLVPAPIVGANTQLLRGDGTWAPPHIMAIYYYIASTASVIPPASTPFQIPFAAVASTRGTAIVAGFNGTPTTPSQTVPVNQFALAPGYSYAISFGFAQLIGTPGTPTYIPPSVGIYSAASAAASATSTAVATSILTPTPIAYGKYYCPGGVVRAYLAPTATTYVAAMLTGAATDTLAAPWIAIDVI